MKIFLVKTVWFIPFATMCWLYIFAENQGIINVVSALLYFSIGIMIISTIGVIYKPQLLIKRGISYSLSYIAIISMVLVFYGAFIVGAILLFIVFIQSFVVLYIRGKTIK